MNLRIKKLCFSIVLVMIFIEESLSKSMVQYWNNYETVILDDSKSNEYIEKVKRIC
nr:hypothetical protein [Mycoplasmopsis bovis]